MAGRRRAGFRRDEPGCTSRHRRRRGALARARAVARCCSPRPVGSGPTSTWPGRRLLPPPPGGGAARGRSTRPSLPTCSLPTSSSTDRSERSAIVAVLGGAAAEDGDDGLVLAPSVLGRGHDVVVPPGEPLDRLRERLRGRGVVEVTARGPRDMAGPAGDRPDGVRLRTGRAACRGRARGHDRLHEGVLPGPGVGGQGQEPRTPPVGPATRPWGRADPSREHPSSPTAPRWGGDERRRRRRGDGRHRPDSLGRGIATAFNGGPARFPYGTDSRHFGSFRIRHLGVCTDPARRPLPRRGHSVLFLRSRTHGHPGGRNGNGADRSTPDLRHRRIAREPLSARCVAGTLRLLRDRSRRLLPDLRRGGGSRPRRSAAPARSARNASPGRSRTASATGCGAA